MRPQMKDSTRLRKLQEQSFFRKHGNNIEAWDTDASDDENDLVAEKHVRFNSTVKTHKIMALNEYSKTEMKTTWLTDRELGKMTAEREKVLKRLEKGKDEKEDMTYRGLECWTKQGAEDLDECIAHVIAAVMDEQDRQWNTNSDDARIIAQKSRAVTVSTAIRARNIAKKDEEEAMAYQKESTVEEDPPIETKMNRKSSRRRLSVRYPSRSKLGTKSSTKQQRRSSAGIIRPLQNLISRQSSLDASSSSKH